MEATGGSLAEAPLVGDGVHQESLPQKALSQKQSSSTHRPHRSSFLGLPYPPKRNYYGAYG